MANGPQVVKGCRGGIDFDFDDDRVYDLEELQELAKTICIPSKCNCSWWISATNKSNRNNQAPTRKNGKWLIFCQEDEVDDAWSKIAKSTEEGHLGHASKVSTLKKSEPYNKYKSHVICVYTYDYSDEADVKRAREHLTELGYTSPLSYKSDNATTAGLYSASGHKGISTYRY